MGERRGAYRLLVGTPEGRRLLARPKRRWEDNIKMVLREVGCGGMAHDREWGPAVMIAVMNLRFP